MPGLGTQIPSYLQSCIIYEKDCQRNFASIQNKVNFLFIAPSIVEDYVTFCPIFHVSGQSYSGVWKELPKDWLEGLNIAKQVKLPRISKLCFISLSTC